MTSSVIQVVDNFIDSISNTTGDAPPTSTDDSASSSILNSLENQISASLHAGREIRTVRPNLAVESVQWQPDSTKGDLSFVVIGSNSGVGAGSGALNTDSVRLYRNESVVPRSQVETSILLPKSLLSGGREGKMPIKGNVILSIFKITQNK